MAEVRQQHAAHQPLSNANRPKPAVNSAPPRPSTSSLVHCPSSLPTVQAVASRTHPAPLHFFTSSLVHFFTSSLVHCPCAPLHGAVSTAQRPLISDL
jgi:hypothetical protein